MSCFLDLTSPLRNHTVVMINTVFLEVGTDTEFELNQNLSLELVVFTCLIENNVSEKPSATGSCQ